MKKVSGEAAEEEEKEIFTDLYIGIFKESLIEVLKARLRALAQSFLLGCGRFTPLRARLR